MAQATVAIIETIRRYVRALEAQGIQVDDAILFGSFAKGTAKDESDIDVALISSAFSGNRFDDRRRIVPLRRAIDERLEPIPFRPNDFAEGGNLVDEIKRDGIRIEM
ncbi:nucleotidyltransferase domain-containing protein [Desulfuromonas acetexigens]|uniref:Nucleotidyltransferase domain-containing protein n=1 Tax=Trichloromonas acetexigens TaxID=38815 RepID=A0A550J6G3_9BACT|nr:nucleotidyltransferase domain-containing protein [Desulfuromonas acetexigens]TRO78820.1 nucleotidyltransferase domain-containing protein [Desulfuromonas acetexigens]